MKTFIDPTAIGSSVVVLGMFDGVHLGHQALLAAGRELADAAKVSLAVCTFEPHPLEVLVPDHAPKRLTLPEERTACMARYGVDALCVHTFSMERANQEPEAFLDELMQTYQPAAVVCGFNFSFGRRGQGTPELLAAYGAAHDFPVQIIPPITLSDIPISSTRIRKALDSGDIEAASALLGRPYLLQGTVVHGKHIGTTIGYPTANLAVPELKALPKNGVYAAFAETAYGKYPAVVNIGNHPTLPDGTHTIEAHLLDVTLDLYDQHITLALQHYLRAETQFANMDALKAQIAKDCEAVRQAAIHP